jgi:hypothetical protein
MTTASLVFLADLTVERIGDLVTHDLSELLSLEVLR